MIALDEKTNVDAPDSEFEFGSIRDKTGIVSGTPVSKQVYSDMHQFFMKLMKEAGIVPNGQFDNAYNGYQLWDAMMSLTPYIRYEIFKRHGVAADINSSTISGSFRRFNVTAITNEFDLSTSPALNIVSFGNDAPIGTELTFYFTASSGIFTITLNSTNAGAFPIITQDGIAASNTAYTINSGRYFKVVRNTFNWRIINIE